MIGNRYILPWSATDANPPLDRVAPATLIFAGRCYPPCELPHVEVTCVLKRHVRRHERMQNLSRCGWVNDDPFCQPGKRGWRYAKDRNGPTLGGRRGDETTRDWRRHTGQASSGQAGTRGSLPLACQASRCRSLALPTLPRPLLLWAETKRLVRVQHVPRTETPRDATITRCPKCRD